MGPATNKVSPKIFKMENWKSIGLNQIKIKTDIRATSYQVGS